MKNWTEEYVLEKLEEIAGRPEFAEKTNPQHEKTCVYYKENPSETENTRCLIGQFLYEEAPEAFQSILDRNCLYRPIGELRLPVTVRVQRVLSFVQKEADTLQREADIHKGSPRAWSKIFPIHITLSRLTYHF